VSVVFDRKNEIIYRFEEVMVASLPIGHTNLTHGRLLRGDLALACNRCDVSVLHIVQKFPVNEGRKTFHHSGTLCNKQGNDCGNVFNSVV
jgi:hypothetical protein